MKKFENSLLEIVQLRGGIDILRNPQKTLEVYENLYPGAKEKNWIREAFECGAIPYMVEEIDRGTANYVAVKNGVYHRLSFCTHNTVKNAKIMVCMFRAVQWNELANEVEKAIPKKQRIGLAAAAAVLCLTAGTLLTFRENITEWLKDTADTAVSENEKQTANSSAAPTQQNAEKNTAVSDPSRQEKEVTQENQAASGGISEVVWRGMGLTDISQVKNYPDVEILDLGRNKITDLSPLSGLERLSSLNIYNNPCSNLTSLTGLTSLTRLDLGETPAEDLSAVASLKNLTYLDIWYTKVSDLSALSGLTKLENVYLSHSMVASLDPLVNLPNIKVLSISDLSINDGSLERFRQTHPNCTIYNFSREEEMNMADSYLMPQSSVYVMSREFLQRYSVRELWIAKNEIFARKGRIFKNQELQNYFNSKSWYHGTIEPEIFDADPNNYTDVEKENVALMIELGADSYVK